MVDQLSIMVIKFDDEIIALMILASLPKSWKTLKVSLTNTAPNGVVSVEVVKNSRLNEEIGHRSQGSTSFSESEFWLLKKGGEVKWRVQAPETRVEESQTNMQMSSVITARRKVTSSYFFW